MKKTIFICLAALFVFVYTGVLAQMPSITLHPGEAVKKVSPTLYGLMTEEINHSYDGGLYAELIRNRIFKDNRSMPEGWSLVKDNAGDISAIHLIAANEEHIPIDERGLAINSALSTCLRLTVEKVSGRIGIANEGFWGIPVKPSSIYRASFYIKGTARKPPFRWPWEPKPTTPPLPDIENNTAGPITVSIESNDGKTVFASGTINLEKSDSWKKYELTLTTPANIQPTKDARFVISTTRTGLYYFNLVSLFPATYNNHPNGNRVDIMQMLVDMKPAFLRFPGGNFLEGPLLTDAFPWKSTLGPLENRPGHKGSWGYRPSDGMGLLEFLTWCEDMGAEPVLAVHAGYALSGDHVDAGPLLKPYVDDALDEIEYVTGDTTTYWGAKRAAGGHPKPFKLRYVEIGNEDWFDRFNSYNGRFNQFRAAIETKYPNLKCISTIADAQYPSMKVTGKPVEIVDEHYYRDAWEMWENASQYDKYDRNGPKIFVGEWATREGFPTTNLNAALGDAAWMTGMERNADLVIMSCYAPLFVNVNKATATAPKAWQWDSDLIGYDALNAYGSPSYYVQKVFANYLGNKIVPATFEHIPVQNKPQSKKDSVDGSDIKQVPTLFYSATMNDSTGVIYLKVVNTKIKEQTVQITLDGVNGVLPDAAVTTIKGNQPGETNTITDPEKIIPSTSVFKRAGKHFMYTMPALSINVLQLQVK